MNLWWATDSDPTSGNSLGYARSMEAMRGALVEAGATFDPAAAWVIHLTHPSLFRPFAGRKNVLFTMHESVILPPWFHAGFAGAEALVVPSEWGARALRQYTDRPVFVVPLGVDVARFPLIRRQRPRHRPFRFLWLAASDPHKGYDDLARAWMHGSRPLRDDPRVELYLKTTIDPTVPIDMDEVVHRDGNVVVDPRRLPHEALLALYASADAFVLPTQGEGWGLPLLEAMATGLPCITILETGLTAFADRSTCLGVTHHPVTLWLRQDGHALHMEPHVAADIGALAAAMRRLQHAPHDLRTALGQRAAARAQQFTWAAAGQRLLTVCEALAHPEEDEDGHDLRAHEEGERVRDHRGDRRDRPERVARYA